MIDSVLATCTPLTEFTWIVPVTTCMRTTRSRCSAASSGQAAAVDAQLRVGLLRIGALFTFRASGQARFHCLSPRQVQLGSQNGRFVTSLGNHFGGTFSDSKNSEVNAVALVMAGRSSIISRICSWWSSSANGGKKGMSFPPMILLMC